MAIEIDMVEVTDKLRFATGSPFARRRSCKSGGSAEDGFSNYLQIRDFGREGTQSLVNQVVANQPEFAAAFRCAIGTPMNPTKRCAVW
ncbi:hypothetical protein COOONC_27517 [Cooperia oncophora]